jgi:hypothetical protein
LEFEELPYSLKEIANRQVVKVQHYLIDGTKDQIYTELIENEKNFWRLCKEVLVPKHLL